jgi:hypothetical protein
LQRSFQVEAVLYTRAIAPIAGYLTPEEAIRLIEFATHLFRRAMLTTMYSTGTLLRLSREAAGLQAISRSRPAAPAPKSSLQLHESPGDRAITIGEVNAMCRTLSTQSRDASSSDCHSIPASSQAPTAARWSGVRYF